MNFGVALCIFTAIFEVTLGIFAMNFLGDLDIFTGMFRASSGAVSGGFG